MTEFALLYALSAVGLATGALVMSVPSARARRIGFTVVSDSVLVAFFGTVLLLTRIALFELPARIAGYDQADFIAWITAEINALGMVTALLKALEVGVGVAVFPLSAMIGMATLKLLMLRAIANVFFNYAVPLLILGVLMYAVPLRLARQAGAGMIATVIVLNIALPFMPIFVGEFRELGIFVPVEAVEVGIVGLIGRELLELYFGYVLPLFILGMVYVAIVLAATYALSRELGGRALTLPFVE